MKKSKTLILFLMAAFLLLSVSTPSHAANVPDLSRQGSITVHVKDTESKAAVSGGSLTLYQVALAETEDGNYCFQYTESFKDCEIDLGDLQSERLAEELADYVKSHNIDRYDMMQVSDGKVVFNNLKLGVYLVMQEKAAEKYSALAPFVISIPLLDGESYIYDVDASPKAGTVTKHEPTTETPPTTESTPPERHSGGKLPQTGQLWWPVPILAFGGIILFAYGWKRRNDA